MDASPVQDPLPRSESLHSVLSYKRLERGRFASPWREDGQVVRMTASELALFVEGCEWVGRRALSPEAVVPSPLGR